MILLYRLFLVITHAGLPVFITSIFLNMVCSETMCSLEIKQKFDTFIGVTGAKVYIRPLTSNIIMMIAFPLMWGSTGAMLGCALYYPFLGLTASFMKQREYSPIHMATANWTDGYQMFSVLVLIVIIIMPLAKHISILAIWVFNQKVRGLEKHLEVVKAIGKWAMVDVFCIAFAILQAVSDSFIPGVVVVKGFYFMLAYLFLNYLLDALTHFWIKRIIECALGTGPKDSILVPKTKNMDSMQVSIDEF